MENWPCAAPNRNQTPPFHRSSSAFSTVEAVILKDLDDVLGPSFTSNLKPVNGAQVHKKKKKENSTGLWRNNKATDKWLSARPPLRSSEEDLVDAFRRLPTWTAG